MSNNPPRNQLEPYPQYNLSNQLLQHQLQMLQFLYFTEYDIIYETFELKHAAYLEKRRGEVVKRLKSEEIAHQYEIMSERVHIRILRDDIDLDKKLSRLELVWHHHSTPYFHRYYFIKYIFTTYFKNLDKLISTEEKLIKEEQHIYYSISRAINARQACLRSLKRFLTQLSPEDVYQYLHVAKQRVFVQKRKQEQEKYKIQGYKVKMVTDNREEKLSKTKLQSFSDSFNHLTKLTIYAIELIIKWREYIHSLTHDPRKKKERVQYYFYDDNYFLKVLTDLGFIKSSFLANFYDFAPKNDPFMLRPILAFQKREQKTIQNELLKQIFMPLPEQLSEILAKTQYLSEQYKNNIRSRRVYDLNSLKKPLMIAAQKSLRNNEPRPPISNIVLQKISSPIKASKSLKSFRVRESSSKKEKEKIIIDFKTTSKRRNNISLPGAKEKMIVERQTSPVKNSIILEKNPINSNVEELIDSKLLGILKQEVIKKIKQQFAEQKKETVQKNQALEMYVDEKVKEAMKDIFPYEPEKQLKKPIQFTTMSFNEEQVSGELSKIFKKSMFRFREMQYNENQLLKKIEHSEYCYFVRANIGEEQIGELIVTLDREVKEYKALRVLYVGFYDLSQLQMLMLKFVQFLWKYENSYQIIYSFMLPASNQYIEQVLTTLQNNLQHNCISVVKQVYSSVADYRYIFKRKHKNTHYIPNKYPISLHVSLSALLSERKLMLQNATNKRKPQPICFDYLLMDILRRFVSSDDFVILKEKIKWTDRLKQLLQVIILVEKNKGLMIPIKVTEAENVTELNKILSKGHDILMEVSDLTKVNLMKLLRFQLSLSLPFLAKSVYGRDQVQYYKYSINQTIQYWATDTNDFYFFPSNQIKGMVLVFFSANEYLSLEDAHLTTYLKKNILKASSMEKEVYNFWVPMFRYPCSYQERQEIYLPTYRFDDLHPIKKDLLIGQQVEFFCSMQMQNGIRYHKTKHDVCLQKPFGIAALMGEERTLIYGRIVDL